MFLFCILGRTVRNLILSGFFYSINKLKDYLIKKELNQEAFVC